MDNVQDLKQTTERIVRNTPNQQPISLSALGTNQNNAQAPVSINTTNGLSGVQSGNDEREHQVVRINPNPIHRKVARRTIEDPSQLNTVNPNEVIPQQQAKPVSVTPRDKAMNLLADAVNRKQQEYRDFIAQATAEDAMNRERVEDGMEEVGGEMNYMPEALQTPIPEEQKVQAPQPSEEEEFFAEDEPAMVDDGSGFEMEAPTNVRIAAQAPTFDTESENNDESTSNEAYYAPSDYQEPATEEEEVAYGDPTQQTYYEDGEEPDPDDVNNIPLFKRNDPMPVEEPKVEPDVEYTPASKNIVASAIGEVSSADFDVDEADFEDVTQDTEEQLTDEQIEALEQAAERNLRSDILKKIINTGKRVNTTQFTVSNKVVTLKEAMRNVKPEAARTASWPMMFAGRPFVASSLKGPEIAMMAEMEESNNTGFAITREQARIIYEHDASPYRPSTLESWCKTIPLADLDNLFAALYLASMKNANYLPMVCQKNSCRHAYLSDDIPIESMIKIDKDETKKRFDEIRNMELTADSACSYESVITVINDNFAIGIKMPSVFNALYEYNTLNSEFITKYASIIAVLQYVDYVYYIDPETQQFQPIGWKTYHGDYTKTYKSKIATYAKIFKEFSPTDFTLMTSIIDSMVVREAESKVVILEVPEAKCPKCGADIPAHVMSARQMLFTQQRLVTLATMPIEK